MSVPLIDLGAAPPAALARQIDAALRGAGFFAITGHGVPVDVVQAAFDAGHRFFALPQAEKERWHIDGGTGRRPTGEPGGESAAPGAVELGPGASSGPPKRGFDPIGWQALDPTRPPDLKESFYLGEEHLGPNQWPDEALVPGFRAALDAYSMAMQALARRLMALFETALELPAGHFDAYTRQPTCTTRLLHYPQQPAQAAPGQIGCGAHTDWGALTLLAQDEAGGLQVQRGRDSQEGTGLFAAGIELSGDRAHTWLDVPPLPGTLVVNVGDMMQRWTNDRWPSTLHRVINRYSGRDRWSIAYFFDLDAQARIEPLPSCVSAARPSRYGPITAGEHLAEMYRRTTVAA